MRRRRDPRAWPGLAGVALGLAAAGCGATPPTQIVIRIDTDMTEVYELGQVTVVARRAGAATPIFERSYVLGGTRNLHVPGEIALTTPHPDDARAVRVEVSAWEPLVLPSMERSQRLLFTWRAQAAFRPGKAVRLDVFLARRCRDATLPDCEEGTTCGRCSCEPVVRESLPELTPGERDASTSGCRPLGYPPPTAADASLWPDVHVPRDTGSVPETGPDDAGLDAPAPADATIDARVDDAPADLGVVDTGVADTGRLPRELVFAVRRNVFGLDDGDSWTLHGFDRDGLCTSGRPNVQDYPCSTGTGGQPVFDGDRGRDNAFGARLLGPLGGIGVVGIFNQMIANGTTTLGVRIRDFDGPDDDHVEVDVLPLIDGAPPGLERMQFDPTTWPRFDGRDVWHVWRTAAYDTVTGTLLVRLTTAYVSCGTLVVPLPARTRVYFSRGTDFVRFTYSRAVIAGPISADGSRMGPMEISAVMPVEDLFDDITTLGLCPSNPASFIAQGVIRNSTDMLASGEVDPTRPCDAVPVGFGLEVIPVQLGDERSGPAITQRCTDAGIPADVMLPADVVLPADAAFPFDLGGR